jgi:hypothetical protein
MGSYAEAMTKDVIEVLGVQSAENIAVFPVDFAHVPLNMLFFIASLKWKNSDFGQFNQATGKLLIKRPSPYESSLSDDIWTDIEIFVFNIGLISF